MRTSGPRGAARALLVVALVWSVLTQMPAFGESEPPVSPDDGTELPGDPAVPVPSPEPDPEPDPPVEPLPPADVDGPADVPASDPTAPSEPTGEPGPDLVAVPAGSLTVTPSTGLVDGQVVTLKGSGWGANTFLGAAQCTQFGSFDGCELGDIKFFNANAAGRFTVTFPVETIIDAAAGQSDCRLVTCVIGVNSTFSATGAAITPLAFDPSGPLLPPPVVTATPDSGLVDGQAVTIAGTGFRPEQYAFIALCRLPSTDGSGCASSIGMEVEADGAGTIATTLTVDALFAAYGPSGVEVVDCRSVTCGLVVFVGNSPGEQVIVPLGFDPGAPLRPPPTLDATPDSGLVDAQVVELSGGGYGPGQYVEVLQCPSGAIDADACSSSGYGVTDDGGNLNGFLIARTLLKQRPNGPVVDCRVTSCSAVAVQDGFSILPERAGITPLGFDPDAPAGVHPAIDVAPASGLVDGQQVTVSGTGFRPFESLGLIQCIAGAGGIENCDVGTLSYSSSDGPAIPLPPIFFAADLTDGARPRASAAYGNMWASFTVKRVLTLGDGRTVDCAVTPCILGVGDIGQVDRQASHPLAFDPVSATITPADGPIRGSPTATG